ncbi:MAG: sigma-70 family RNA polymerase sigma factor [Planctomycetes bacterium]|nr:sigma-70 family RNA polymerase sigma factor [Planctomycetota bacterium]
MESDGSVTRLIGELKRGDADAAQAIWERYYERLVSLARGKLGNLSRRAADEEDVAASAFHSFYEAARAGRFPRLEDRHDLWKLLVTITARKALGQIKRAHTKKRGSGKVRGESVFLAVEDSVGVGGIEQVMGREPTPEFAAQVGEQFEVLLDSLADETLRRIVLLKMQGYSNSEIAEQLNCVPRTVERKLERIRDKWSGLAGNPAEG